MRCTNGSPACRPMKRAAALPSVNGSPPGNWNGKVALGTSDSDARLDDDATAVTSLASAKVSKAGFQLREGWSAIHSFNSR